MDINKLATELKNVSPLPTMPREIFDSLRDLLPIAVAELLIMHPDGSVLLVHKSGDFMGWALPSGYIGLNESFEDACRRIAKRDLGTDIKSVTFISVFNWPIGSLRLARGHTISILFKCEVIKDIESGEYFKILPDEILKHHKAMIDAVVR